MSTKLHVILIVALILVLAMTDMTWLGLVLFLPVMFYFLVRSQNSSVNLLKKNYSFLFYLMVSLFAFASVIVARVLVLEMYTVPTASMQNTLRPGDRILVSKLQYGPRLPRTPFDIPWINAFLYFNDAASSTAVKNWWKYKRLNGYSAIMHHDIVVFSHPDDEKQILVKRCVAKPGDTVKISNGVLYVNRHQEVRPPRSMMRYAMKYNNQTKAIALLNSLRIPFETGMGEGTENVLFLHLDLEMKLQLSNSEWVDGISQAPIDRISYDYPEIKSSVWTDDNYGPVVIPKRGMTIPLTKYNCLIYKKYIERDAGTEVWKDKMGSLESKAFYTFQKDYYFMMGDNRNESRDSRFWGFIPEDHIIGKAVMVLFSSNKDGLEWKRTCRLL